MNLGRFNMKGYDIEVVDEQARNDIEEVRESIPQYTSQLTNDSDFITSADIPPIPTKTSELENDSGFTTFTGNYNDLTNKPTIPNVSSTYTSPFNKLRLGNKAIVYGTAAAQTVAVTNAYVVNVAYYADVTINIPSGARLTSLGSVSVQSINGLGLLAIDILEQEVDHIKIRLFSPKSESITLGFSIQMFGDY